ncbi:MAG TPA: hypothetical protein VED16_00640 [Candidatus Acidoferrum sp.]|nr:hypothetical protein [Candidatus Acidoferrum sp.]
MEEDKLRKRVETAIFVKQTALLQHRTICGFCQLKGIGVGGQHQLKKE